MGHPPDQAYKTRDGGAACRVGAGDVGNGKDGRAPASIYHGIEDPVEKQEFLRTFVGIAHFTPYGVCTHDLRSSPAPRIRTAWRAVLNICGPQGDAEERQNLVRLRTFTVGELLKAEHAFEGGVGPAGNWVAFESPDPRRDRSRPWQSMSRISTRSGGESGRVRRAACHRRTGRMTWQLI